MTGFGRGEAEASGYRVTLELKAVNNRFLEVVVRVPRVYNALEEKLRKEVQGRIQRGRIEMMVNIDEVGERKKRVKVDKDLVVSYDKILKDLSIELATEYQTDLYRLVTLPEVLLVEESATDLRQLAELADQAVHTALDALLAVRLFEGDKLAQDLRRRFSDIEDQLEQITARSESVVTEYRSRLAERIRHLLDEVVLDESKLANEVAFFADRASITEELVRMRSHLAQGRQALDSQEPVGRKLDFILQEMNRETNTIGSKANNVDIAQSVIYIKSELEKIREQIQNIE
jgi:uncharacterized protein (TIGR00255 family)